MVPTTKGICFHEISFFEGGVIFDFKSDAVGVMGM